MCTNMEKRKRLFHEDTERYTERGHQFDLEVGEALRPILNRLFDEGYSTRDAENVLFWTVGDLCVSRRLDVDYQEQKKLKEAGQA